MVVKEQFIKIKNYMKTLEKIFKFFDSFLWSVIMYSIVSTSGIVTSIVILQRNLKLPTDNFFYPIRCFPIYTLLIFLFYGIFAIRSAYINKN